MTSSSYVGPVDMPGQGNEVLYFAMLTTVLRYVNHCTSLYELLYFTTSSTKIDIIFLLCNPPRDINNAAEECPHRAVCG